MYRVEGLLKTAKKGEEITYCARLSDKGNDLMTESLPCWCSPLMLVSSIVSRYCSCRFSFLCFFFFFFAFFAVAPSSSSPPLGNSSSVIGGGDEAGGGGSVSSSTL